MSKVNVKINYKNKEECSSGDVFMGVNASINDNDKLEVFTHIYGKVNDTHRAELITNMIDHLIKESSCKDWIVAYIIEHMSSYGEELMESLEIKEEGEG